MSGSKDYDVSTGNVYADLGDRSAREMHRKALIALEIHRLIESRHLTQVQAAEVMGIDQPKVSQILRGHFRGISVDRLIELVASLGVDVTIDFAPTPAAQPGRIVVGGIDDNAGYREPIAASSTKLKESVRFD